MIPGFCEQVTDVCAVPNAPAQFAIASRDGRIGIVDVVSKKLLRTLETGHAGELRLSLFRRWQTPPRPHQLRQRGRFV
jgi:hypothetical protein